MQHLPHPALRPFIKKIWVTSQTAASRREYVLPTGCMTLVFRLSGQPLCVVDDAQSARIVGYSTIGGARSTFCMKDVSAPTYSVGAVLLPGAAEILFGIPADAFAEQHTRLEDLWGSNAVFLREQLMVAESASVQLALFESFLLARLPRVQGLHPAIAQALMQLDADTEVRDLVQHSGYSHRRFIELFRRTTGLTPKLYSRVIRFQRVVRRVSVDVMADWSDLALASGYSDQSHFNREFREFSGVTPETYRKLAPVSANHISIDDRPRLPSPS